MSASFEHTAAHAHITPAQWQTRIFVGPSMCPNLAHYWRSSRDTCRDLLPVCQQHSPIARGYTHGRNRHTLTHSHAARAHARPLPDGGRALAHARSASDDYVIECACLCENAALHAAGGGDSTQIFWRLRAVAVIPTDAPQCY